MSLPRQVLFFSLRPKFDASSHGDDAAASVDVYDSGTQIHVGWLLSREGYALEPSEQRRVMLRYKAHNVDLQGFGRREEHRGLVPKD